MTPFVSATLLALGPYIVPILIAIITVWCFAAAWLFEKGIFWRVIASLMFAAPLAIMLPLVLHL